MPRILPISITPGAIVICCLVLAASAAAARPQALAKDGAAVPAVHYQDCKASQSQARLDQSSQTIFVKGNGLDDAVLKCLNQWADRHKFRVVLQPVIE